MIIDYSYDDDSWIGEAKTKHQADLRRAGKK